MRSPIVNASSGLAVDNKKFSGSGEGPVFSAMDMKGSYTAFLVNRALGPPLADQG